jgi:hypothetical protein
MSVAFNTGDVWDGMKQDKDILQAVNDGKITWQQISWASGASGALIGAIDLVSINRVMKAAGIGKDVAGQAAKQLTKTAILKAAASGAAWEGPTEAIQSVIAQATEIGMAGVSMEDVDWVQRAMRTVNEFAAGAVGGGSMAGGKTAYDYKRQQTTAAQPAQPAGTGPGAIPPPAITGTGQSAGQPTPAGPAGTAQNAAPPVGAPHGVSQEAGKKPTPVAGATTPVVIQPGSVDPGIAAAAAAGVPAPTPAAGTPAQSLTGVLPDDEDVTVDTTVDADTTPEGYTPAQAAAASSWAQQYAVVDSDQKAALAATPGAKGKPKKAAAPATPAPAVPAITEEPEAVPTAPAAPAAAASPITPAAVVDQEPATVPASAPASPAAATIPPEAAAGEPIVAEAPPVVAEAPPAAAAPAPVVAEAPAPVVAPAPNITLVPRPAPQVETVTEEAPQVAAPERSIEEIIDIVRQHYDESLEMGEPVQRRAVMQETGLNMAQVNELLGQLKKGAKAPVLKAPEKPVEAPPAVAAPEAPPMAEPAPTAQAASRRPALSRQLADAVQMAVRERVGELKSEVVEHPDLRRFVDETADELTAGLSKGVAPAEAIRSLTDRGVARVKEKVNAAERERIMAEHDKATEQDAKAQEVHAKRLVGEADSPTAGQQAARSRKAVAPAEKLKKQKTRAWERLLEKHPENANLKARQYHHDRRKAIKGYGGSKEIKAKRAYHTEQMEKAEAAYTAEQEAKGNTIAAKQAETAKRTAEQEEIKASQEGQGGEGRQAIPTTAQEGAMQRHRAKTSQRLKAASNAVKPATELEIAKPESARRYIQQYYDTIKQALNTFHQDIHQSRSAAWLAPEENLAIFGRELLKGRHKGLPLHSFFTAQALVKSGTAEDLKEFKALVSEASATARTAESWSSSEGTGIEPSLDTTEEDNTFPVREGPHSETIVPHRTTSGRQLMGEATKGLRGTPGKFWHRAWSLLRHVHTRALNSMVGDIKVHFISKADMDKMYRNAAGMYRNYDANERVGGNVGFIAISQEAWDARSPERRYELIQHEMTHAATSFAIVYNVRGTKDIIDKMRKSLKLQMSGRIPAEFDHAFSNAQEFVTAAFTNPKFQQWMMHHEVPIELRKQIGALSRHATPTWWQTFAQAVSNALGVFRPSTGEYSNFSRNGYFEQILQLHPHIMQTEARQQELAEVASEFPGADPERTQMYIELFGKDSLRRLRAGVAVVSNDAFDIDAYKGGMEASLDAAIQKSRSMVGRVNDWIATRALSTHMLKREYMDELGGKGHGFEQEIDLLTSREHERNQFKAAGIKVISDWVEYARANPREAEEVGQTLWDATENRYDAAHPLSHDNNKHITKTGERDRNSRVAHAAGHAAYNGFTPEGQAQVRAFTEHFKNEANDTNRQLVYNILHHANDAHPFGQLPPGWTVDRLVDDWVMNGRIDRPMLPGNPRLPQPNDRTPEDQEIHNALGKVVETLRDSAELRSIKGTYLPMLREGNHVLSAQHEVATPAGAYKDKATGNPDTDKYINEFVFANLSEYRQYLADNNAKPADQRDALPDKVQIEHRDPATWAKVHPKDHRAHTYYRVRVQNRVVEMSNDRHELEELRKEYLAKGFQADLVGKLKKDVMFGERSINSAQVNRLIRSAQQGSASGTTSSKMQAAAINDAFLRQLSGQRASHRKLKRKGVKGYNRDLIDMMLQHNHGMSGYRASLKQAIPLARAEKKTNDLLDSMQKNQYGAQDRFYRLQSAVEEVRLRATQSIERNERTTGARWVNNIMAISAINKLASPAYHFINATGPTLAVAMAGAKHGNWRAAAAMTQSYRDLGGHRIIGKGIKETAAEAVAGIKALAGVVKGDKLAAITPRKQEDYNTFLINRMRGKPLGAVFEKGLNELNRLGLGASSGIEAPELDEASMNKTEKFIARSSRITRAAGEAVEHVNRSHVLLMYLRIAKQDGMSDEAAVDYAVDQTERSQGGYAAENQQRIMNNPVFRLPGQFKKYGAMYATAYYNALTRIVKPGDRALAAREVANMSLLGAAFAGVTGTALQEVAHAFAMVAGSLGLGGDDTWEDWKDWQQEMLQDILGRKWGEVAAKGLPRMLNIDVADRMANDSLLLYGDPKSYTWANGDMQTYLFDLAVGAGGGLLSKGLFKEAQEAESATDIIKMIPWPKVVDDIWKAAERINDVTRNKYGTVTGEKYSTAEAVVQGLGFSPASRAREYEPGGIGRKRIDEAKMRHERTLLMGEWYAADDKAAARQKIRDFNASHPREMRIEFKDLMNSRRKRRQDERENLRERRQAEMAE